MTEQDERSCALCAAQEFVLLLVVPPIEDQFVSVSSLTISKNHNLRFVAVRRLKLLDNLNLRVTHIVRVDKTTHESNHKRRGGGFIRGSELSLRYRALWRDKSNSSREQWKSHQYASHQDAGATREGWRKGPGSRSGVCGSRVRPISGAFLSGIRGCSSHGQLLTLLLSYSKNRLTFDDQNHRIGSHSRNDYAPLEDYAIRCTPYLPPKADVREAHRQVIRASPRPDPVDRRQHGLQMDFAGIGFGILFCAAVCAPARLSLSCPGRDRGWSWAPPVWRLGEGNGSFFVFAELPHKIWSYAGQTSGFGSIEVAADLLHMH